MVLVRPHAASQVQPGRAVYLVHLHHMWLWLNKAWTGSSGCSDMFRHRCRDSYSFQMHEEPLAEGFSPPSDSSFFLFFLTPWCLETGCNLVNVVFPLSQTCVVTSFSAANKHSFSWGSCLFDPPPLPSLLIPRIIFGNPVSMTKCCCFNP